MQTANHIGHLSMVGPLLGQMQSPITSVTADGAYDTESVYRVIAERRSQPPLGQ